MVHIRETALQTMREQDKKWRLEWERSLERGRGVSYEDFLKAKVYAGKFWAFEDGAEVVFIKHGKVQTGKVSKVEVKINTNDNSEIMHCAFYYIDDDQDCIDGADVFISEEELQAHLLGDKDFILPLEAITNSRYTAHSIELHEISSHVWYMADSMPEYGWIDQIDIQITHSGMDIFYLCKHGLPCGPNRYSTKYRKADEIFRTEEELVRSI